MNSLLSKTIGNIGSHILPKCVETTSAVPALCLSFRLRRWRINLEGGLVKIVANKEGWVFTFKSWIIYTSIYYIPISGDGHPWIEVDTISIDIQDSITGWPSWWLNHPSVGLLLSHGQMLAPDCGSKFLNPQIGQRSHYKNWPVWHHKCFYDQNSARKQKVGFDPKDIHP